MLGFISNDHLESHLEASSVAHEAVVPLGLTVACQSWNNNIELSLDNSTPIP